MTSYQLGSGKEGMENGVPENKAERTTGALAPEVRWCMVSSETERIWICIWMEGRAWVGRW